MTSQSSPQLWRFFGETSISGPNGDLSVRLSKKAVGLLAYLALAREDAGRDELAALLWPAPDLSRSKHNLRQCLLSLRKIFGNRFSEVIEVSDDRLALNFSAIDSDVRMLLDIDEGNAKPDNLPELCRGPFLHGLVTRSGPFDQWIMAQRNRLSRAAERVLTAAHAEAESAGRQSEAIQLAVALADLSIGSTDEPANEKSVSAPTLSRRQRWMRRAALVLGGAAFAAGALFATYYVSPDFRDRVGRIVSGTPRSPPRIAVLPFTAVNGTAEETSLAGGVTLGINFGLYAITAKELFVVTTLLSEQKMSQEELKRVARGLNVRYLIAGSVAVEGDRVRVDALRLDAESSAGDIVRRQEFNKPTAQAFKLQDDITLWILKGLNIDISAAEWSRIQSLDDTDSLDAWLAATMGLRHLVRVTRRNLEIAKASYQNALSFDENYVSARRGLAWVEFLNVRLGWTDDVNGGIREAQRNLEIVLRTAPDDANARRLQGAILLLRGKYDEAIAAGEFAREMAPGQSDGAAVLAHTLTYVGRNDEALELIDEAMEQSPMHPGFYRWIRGRVLRMAGRVTESIEELEKDLGRGEPSIVHLVELTASYSAAGRTVSAKATAAKIRKIDPDFSAEIWLLHPPINVPEVQLRELKYLTDAGL